MENGISHLKMMEKWAKRLTSSSFFLLYTLLDHTQENIRSANKSHSKYLPIDRSIMSTFSNELSKKKGKKIDLKAEHF